MKRFEAFKLEIQNKQLDILPHPPELIENIPGKFQLFLNGENKDFLYKTSGGWRTNRLNDKELTTKLVEMIFVYYKAKDELEKKKLLNQNNIKLENDPDNYR